HEDHLDDDARPERESSAKRQRTSEHSTYTRGESSSQTMKEPNSSSSGELKKRDNPKEVYSTKRIVDVIRVQFDQGYEQEYMKEIMVKRVDGEYKSFTESDSKIYVIRERVHDYQLGLESFQQKVNLTAPTLTLLGIEEQKSYTLTTLPFVGLIYENTKKGKMDYGY
nr:hypothetical protein [Tanacetum cinerariifolium]